MNHRITGFVCITVALLLDQSSKTAALSMPDLYKGIEILSVLNLIAIRNDGVSFGILGGLAPWWTLAAVGVAIAAALIVWLWRTQSTLTAAALGLIIGGALGNVVDRVRYGAVTDFLDFHVGGYHWPAFNFADAAIFCGAGFLLLDSWRSNQTPRETIAKGRCRGIGLKLRSPGHAGCRSNKKRTCQ